MMETDCILPGGLILEDGRKVSRARLRGLTGVEEEWLGEARATPSAVKVTYVLSRCVEWVETAPVDSGLIRRMLVGDRDFLMLQLRRLTLGDNVLAVVACPACQAFMDAEFRISDVAVEPRSQVSQWYASQRGVRFRLPAGADQEAVLGMSSDEAEQTMLRRCLADDEPLLEEDAEAVIADMERYAPQVDVDLDLECPECKHRFQQPFDTSAFFFEEIRSKQGQLLREVHSLALYYHWSEAEILGLQRRRRHAYLRLLSDSLRQE